ncbi:hypothetical protein O1611_g7172 [Lasiodiplodia mahajangana]|uniref:Uncharacterized protein n=1 Tax=Lasiodiplodia mahajangana TaxID=1108764 RepID=A0ACC2JGC3_9PEZI|nr:hypothetical protein O1611_g7172 [Lasiodiplodia mahajangana]
MVVVASEARGSVANAAPGRDIGRMFKTQENKLREWTVYDASPVPSPPHLATPFYSVEDEDGERANVDAVEELTMEDNMTDQEEATRSSEGAPAEVEDDDWEENEESDSQRCQVCGHTIPAFAMSAHERFHAMDG